MRKDGKKEGRSYVDVCEERRLGDADDGLERRRTDEERLADLREKVGSVNAPTRLQLAKTYFSDLRDRAF